MTELDKDIKDTLQDAMKDVLGRYLIHGKAWSEGTPQEEVGFAKVA